jgi:nucleotide-binding universal stress UspA family protein
MNTILVPTDFSKNAELAIDYAIKIAEKSNAKIVICNAYSLPSTSAQMMANLVEILEKKSEDELAKLKKELLSKYQLSEQRLEVKAILGDVLDAVNFSFREDDHRLNCDGNNRFRKYD